MGESPVLGHPAESGDRGVRARPHEAAPRPPQPAPRPSQPPRRMSADPPNSPTPAGLARRMKRVGPGCRGHDRGRGGGVRAGAGGGGGQGMAGTCSQHAPSSPPSSDRVAALQLASASAMSASLCAGSGGSIDASG
jgi:hypothetical protein